MSTCVLYRSLGLRGYEHQSIPSRAGGVVLRMRSSKPVIACPKCHSRNIVQRGTAPRSWSAPPIGRRPVTVFAAVPRIECRDCRCRPVVPVPFADPRRSCTRSFERLVLDLRRCMTLRDAACYLSISKWVVRDIDKRRLRRRFSRPKLRRVRRIAIDEIAVRQGHRDRV